MRLASLCVLLVLAIVAFQLTTVPVSEADTVLLKNGSAIHGDARKEGDKVIIDFGKNGKMTMLASRVAKIIENEFNAFDARPPAPSGKTVRVKLKTGKVHVGRLAPSDDERILTLGIAEGGSVGILREHVDSIEDVKEEPEALPPVEMRAIPTTHIITLKNGRRIKGDLIATPESEPVAVKIGHLGVVSFRRGDVEKVEAVESTYEMPPVAEEKGNGEKPPEAPSVESIKERVRQELLRELLDALIEKKIDDVLSRGAKDLSLRSIAEELPAEVIQDVQFYVRELGRQRNTNRVRAENALKGLGYRALPYLEAAATHPLELTRRAVQRIVKDAADLRGAPYAIEALTDPDLWVRRLAHAAITSLLGARVDYNPSASPRKRAAAQERYRLVWKETQKAFLRETLDESL